MEWWLSTSKTKTQVPCLPSVPCCNCGGLDHQLKACVGPVDKHGFIPGCPRCNVLSHSFADYGGNQFRIGEGYHFLRALRAMKPPIADFRDWRELSPRNKKMTVARP